MSAKKKNLFLELYERVAASHNNDIIELYDRVTRKIEANIDVAGISRDLSEFMRKFNGQKEIPIALMSIFLMGFKVGEFLTKMNHEEAQPPEKKENGPEVIFDLAALTRKKQ